jgi:hypothetical protein
MFLGHYGLALAAKRAAPRTSLGTLTFAAQFLDELWPILLLVGAEQVRIVADRPWAPLDFVYYPYSHSLLMAIVYAVIIGAAYFAIRKYRRGAWVVAALVVSHWLLDLPMHLHDLPLWPGASSPKFGWGWWNSRAVTYVLEFTIYLAGLASYARSTRARDRTGTMALWSYAVVLPVLFVASSGPPPPSVRALAWTTLLIWLFVPWAWWIDKHRDPAPFIARHTPSDPEFVK